MTMPFSFWRTFAAACGLPVLLFGASFYDFCRILFIQVSFARAIATCMLFSAAILAFGLVATLGARLVPWRPSERVQPWLDGGISTVAILGLMHVGLLMLPPGRTHQALDALIYLATAVAVIRIWLFGQAPRALITRILLRAGFVALVVPWFWLAHAIDGYHLFTERKPNAPKAPATTRPRADAPRHVVLVVFDSMRYVSTSLHRPDFGTTPNLRALAAESTWFTQCRTAGEHTLLAMPTVLTGVRPDQYRKLVRNASLYLREGYLTGLARLLEPAGYQSAFATMLVEPGFFGMKEEFAYGCASHLIYPENYFTTTDFIPVRAIESWFQERGLLWGVHLPARMSACGDADDDPLVSTRLTFDQALRHVTSADSPTFTWAHIGAPHSPYIEVAPADLDHPRSADSYFQVTEAMLLEADERQLPQYRKAYQAYLRFADHELGRFIRQLKASGRWDDTLLIVTADHGEGLRPGAFGHDGGTLPEGLTRVPLVIHRPGQRTEEKRTDLVGSEDVTPTVLSAVYGGRTPSLAGQSLLAPPHARAFPLMTWALSLAEHVPYGLEGGLATYEWPYKYYLRLPEREEALYRLDRDPEATRDVASEAPAVLERLRRLTLSRLVP